MKKIHVVIISISMTAVLFTACSGNLPSNKLPTLKPVGTINPTQIPTPTIEPTSISTTYPTSTATPDPRFNTTQAIGRTIIFWHPWVDARAKILDQLALEYNLSNPYKIQVEPRHWGGQDALVDAMTGEIQDPPSLVVLPPEVRPDLTELGWGYIDLLPLIEQPDPAIGFPHLDNYPDPLLLPMRSGDALLGLPAAGDTYVLAYNQTWARELGFTDPPANWQQFVDQSCVAATTNNKLAGVHGTGGWLIDPSPKSILAWFHAFGAPIPYTTETQTTYVNPIYQKVFENLRTLSERGCAWNGRNPSPDIYFSDRLALFVSIPASQIPAFAKSVATAKLTDQWVILPYPGEEASTTWLAEMSYYSILAEDPKDQLAAWLFLRWLIEPERDLRMAVSDGRLPGRQITWDVMSKTGKLPIQMTTWMTEMSGMVNFPYQPGWLLGKAILGDGIRQIMLSNTTLADIPVILQQMDTFTKVMEEQP